MRTFSLCFLAVTMNLYDILVAMMMMMMMIIIMNKLQATTVFSGRQKLTSAMKMRSESDSRLQIDALYM